MTLATREELLRSGGHAVTDVSVEGWGDVRLRELTAKELVFLTGLDGQDQKEAGRVYSRLAAMSLVAETGDRIFDPDDQGDIDALQSKPWSALERMANAIITFNGFGEGEVEARGKNSNAGRKK